MYIAIDVYLPGSNWAATIFLKKFDSALKTHQPLSTLSVSLSEVIRTVAGCVPECTARTGWENSCLQSESGASAISEWKNFYFGFVIDVKTYPMLTPLPLWNAKLFMREREKEVLDKDKEKRTQDQ
jgi:hypothetical protein